ncbi:MAG: pyridoxal kinase PdxY [Propionibacteriaceae bacterium]|jgi:pyridoxine kinase|nr:pyridoxal kinase PdxY [Propionibacteriaceae bacterium]
MSTILSIQSSVAYGHVGNSAAAFALMRMGVETYPVYTVHYSNTTSYGSWGGPNLSPEQVADVIEGVDQRGALDKVDAVLSGFQGSEEMGETILAAVDLVKQRSPQAIYCADPVMGDVGRGIYVGPGIPEFLETRVVPKADVLTPNQFELDYLTKRSSQTKADVLAAVDELHARGPQTILVTSATADDLPTDSVSMLADDGQSCWLVSTPRIDQSFTGSGDLTAAVFLAGLLNGQPLSTVLSRTADVVYSLLFATAAAGSRELTLVADQDQLIDPRFHFEATRLR